MKEVITADSGFCIETLPGPCTTILFGATGNLVQKKLLRAFATLKRENLLNKESQLLLVSRRDINKEQYFSDFPDRKIIEEISSTAVFDPESPNRNISLKNALCGLPEKRLFYFALPPETYQSHISALARTGMLDENSRIIIEKPPGYDRTGTLKLHRLLRRHLEEKQIFLIDHYLGKDEVLNILMMRFANKIFSGIWSSEYISNITIGISEKEGIAGRAAYFDKAGIIRDMFQSHLLFMLALCTTSRTTSNNGTYFDRALLNSLNSIYFDRLLFAGQYQKYRSEPGIPSDSSTLTCADLILRSSSRKWKNTTFRLFSGKSLAVDKTAVKIFFRPAEMTFLKSGVPLELAGNILELELKPEPAISLTLCAKKPGPHLCTGKLQLVNRNFKNTPSDAYARLLLDCQNDDHTLFAGFAPFIRCSAICDDIIKKISTTPVTFYQDNKLDFFL